MEEKQSEAQRQSNLPQITQQISNSYLVMLFVNLEQGESQVPQQYMQFFFLKEKKNFSGYIFGCSLAEYKTCTKVCPGQPLLCDQVGRLIKLMGSLGKEPASQCRRVKRCEFDP